MDRCIYYLLQSRWKVVERVPGELTSLSTMADMYRYWPSFQTLVLCISNWQCNMRTSIVKSNLCQIDRHVWQRPTLIGHSSNTGLLKWVLNYIYYTTFSVGHLLDTSWTLSYTSHTLLCSHAMFDMLFTFIYTWKDIHYWKRLSKYWLA